MATNYPSSVDSFTNPTASDSMATVSHADQHSDVNDAIEAIETKVGVDGSTDKSSLEYRVTNGISDSLTVDTDTLVVDATSNRVGIGTASPAQELHVTVGSGNADVRVQGAGGTDYTDFFHGASDTGLYSSSSSIPMRFSTAGSTRLQIDSSGRVTKPYQPSFSVGHDSGNIRPPSIITWNRVYHNVGGHFASNRFTAPVAGYYFFYWTSIGYNANDVFRLYLYVNGAKTGFSSDIHLRLDGGATGSEYQNGTMIHFRDLAANDYVEIYFTSDGGNILYGNADYLRFGGWLVH